MAINIFMKQFKYPIDEVMTDIKKGDVEKLGIERLRGLYKCLPENDEVLY